MNATPPADWLAWCDARTVAVTSVPGNLALVSYQPVSDDAVELENVPGVTVRRPGAAEGVELTVATGVDLRVDGQPVEGTVFVARTGPQGSPLIRAGRYAFDVFSLDGSDVELRIYDEQAENLDDFDRIDRYPFDPDLAIPGRFAAYASVDAVAWEFTRDTDTGHTKRVPGTITVTLGGQEHDLLAFLDGSELVLVFADLTSGTESYAPGRFLKVPQPEAGAGLLVDFNRAFIPPCGFSYFYSCPIPPEQNRIPVPVRAGEKQVLWKTPR